MAYKGEERGLPIVLHIAGRPVIVLGNGSEADTKRSLLTRAGARIVKEGSKALLAIVIDDAAAISRLKGARRPGARSRQARLERFRTGGD